MAGLHGVGGIPAGAGKMSETLREKQSRFARMVPRLIDKATELGYEVTLGDANRDERVFGAVGGVQGVRQRILLPQVAPRHRP